jgi:uncharacterized RDD family membrane protein YckC
VSLQQPGLPPRYSDDGQWWWDGQRWIPTVPTGPLAAGSGAYLQYAGFWLRFLAYLIDGLILGAAGFVLGLIFGLIAIGIDAASGGSSSTTGTVSSIASVASWVISLVGGWLYFSLQESSARQATIGKMALGIRVTDAEGRRISFGRATARYFSKFLSGLICAIGYVMAGFTQRKQALHDMIARTLVVRAHPTYGQQQPVSSGSAATAAIVSVAVAVGVLIFTSIIVIVILLTLGGQIKNVFSNVVVALNGP